MTFLLWHLPFETFFVHLLVLRVSTHNDAPGVPSGAHTTRSDWHDWPGCCGMHVPSDGL